MVITNFIKNVLNHGSKRLNNVLYVEEINKRKVRHKNLIDTICIILKILIIMIRQKITQITMTLINMTTIYTNKRIMIMKIKIIIIIMMMTNMKINIIVITISMIEIKLRILMIHIRYKIYLKVC